ncbi:MULTISPECIES: hypothetical protein [unclassified Streptomyces]|uniref:hypothetical protein n=1 Tax=unclassified Streptomyces TaxID=2593676 RepID=UPI002E19F011|nr:MULTISPECIES: hypothetical protein [unclassified Streptomyces]
MSRYLRRLTLAVVVVMAVVLVGGLLPLSWVKIGGGWVSFGVVAVLLLVLQRYVDKGDGDE